MLSSNDSVELGSLANQKNRRLFFWFSLVLFLFSACFGLLLLFTAAVEPKDILLTVLLMCVPALLSGMALMLEDISWGGRVIFGLLMGYYSLFVGFAYLRIEVGFPVYVGELGLFLLFILLRHQREGVIRFFKEPVCWFSLVWIVSALPSLSSSIVIHPTNSLRNFSPAYYTVFIYLGYIFMFSVRNPLAVWRTYGRMITVVLLYYALMLPVRHTLAAISPESSPGTPLFGTFVNGYTYGIVFGTWGLILAPYFTQRVRWVQFGSLVVAFECVLITQARSAYLQIFMLICLLWGLRKTFEFRHLRVPVMSGVLVFLFIVVGVTGFGIEFRGDKGPISTHFYRVGTLSLFGAHSADYRDWEQGDAMVGSAYNRVEWWKEVVDKVFESTENAMFGLGFHQPLGTIPGIHVPVQLMNAHGTFATILGRFGVIGLLACLSILGYTFFVLLACLRLTGTGVVKALMAWLLIAFSLFTFAGIWGTWFDAPNHAISFYILIGFALATVRRLSTEPADLVLG